MTTETVDDDAAATPGEPPDLLRVWTLTYNAADAALCKAKAAYGDDGIWRSLPQDVQDACRDVAKAAPFLEALRHVDAVAKAEAAKDDDFRRAMADIHVAAAALGGALRASRSEASTELYLAIRAEAETLCLRTAETRTVLRAAADVVVLPLVQKKQADEVLGLGLAEELAFLQRVKARAMRDAPALFDTHATRDGRAESAKLAEHFARYAADENTAADRYQKFAVWILIALSTVAVIFFVLFHEVTVTELMLKLTFAVPLAVLAGYLAKESARHRQSARWSAELSVKLRSLNAYTAGLNDAEQREYRALLGKGIFGARPAPDEGIATDGPSDGISDMIDKLLTVAERVRDLVRKDGGS